MADSFHFHDEDSSDTMDNCDQVTINEGLYEQNQSYEFKRGKIEEEELSLSNCLNRDPKKLSVKDLRRLVPELRVKCFFRKEEIAGKRKLKRLWDTRPVQWPFQVPFLDPNNPSKDASKKPTKNELMPMFEYLRKLYIHKLMAGELTPSPPPLPQHLLPQQQFSKYSDDIIYNNNNNNRNTNNNNSFFQQDHHHQQNQQFQQQHQHSLPSCSDTLDSKPRFLHPLPPMANSSPSRSPSHHPLSPSHHPLSPSHHLLSTHSPNRSPSHHTQNAPNTQPPPNCDSHPSVPHSQHPSGSPMHDPLEHTTPPLLVTDLMDRISSKFRAVEGLEGNDHKQQLHELHNNINKIFSDTTHSQHLSSSLTFVDMGHQMEAMLDSLLLCGDMQSELFLPSYLELNRKCIQELKKNSMCSQ